MVQPTRAAESLQSWCCWSSLRTVALVPWHSATAALQSLLASLPHLKSSPSEAALERHWYRAWYGVALCDGASLYHAAHSRGCPPVCYHRASLLVFSCCSLR